MSCNEALRLAGYVTPRTCSDCGLGPCPQIIRSNRINQADEALPHALVWVERERCADIFVTAAEQIACQLVAWGYIKLADVPDRVLAARAEFVKQAEAAEKAAS